MKHTLVYDIEIYKNYFLAMFLNADTLEVTTFEAYPEQALDDLGLLDAPIPAAVLDIPRLRKMMQSALLVSFNGINFDLPIITRALHGDSVSELKKIAGKIIKNNLKYWTLDIEPMVVDHIDVFNVAPGMASLKIYSGRLHAQRMQDLPFDPDSEISHEQRPLLREYCANDLQNTLGLYRKLKPQITLREQMSVLYGMDLRSKSDAQIAEAVIKKNVEKTTGKPLTKDIVEPGRKFKYTPPKWVRFKTKPLRDVLAVVGAADFTIGQGGGVIMPDVVADLAITIGTGVYRMGIGGLHSSESKVHHVANDELMILDRDVTSYYPSIILNQGLQPRKMGKAFTTVYRGLVERRIAAKVAGNVVESEALKITINGSFGKFGSQYSVLYAPELLIQTTITGQLALLMLIEDLEAEGIRVVSANTDGVVSVCPRPLGMLMDVVVRDWEQATGFHTEDTEYAALYSRDVNNYIAIKPDGKVKVKGVFAPAGLQKNPANEVCVDAVIKHLQKGTVIEQTVTECRDVRKFVAIRQVKGGAVKNGIYLGKAVRWYYADGETGTIQYQVNGYNVPLTEGAKPLMELPAELPADINYAWYVNESRAMLAGLGVTNV